MTSECQTSTNYTYLLLPCPTHSLGAAFRDDDVRDDVGRRLLTQVWSVLQHDVTQGLLIGIPDHPALLKAGHE